MNIELCMASFALALQAVALIIWIALFSKIERWVWMMVLTGFLIMAAHRVGEVTHYNMLAQFNSFTAILIAVVALISVLQTKRWVRKRDKQTAALLRAHDKLEALANEVQSRQPIATRIAEIINDLRDQIDYYEEQARKHRLPTFENHEHRKHRG